MNTSVHYEHSIAPPPQKKTPNNQTNKEKHTNILKIDADILLRVYSIVYLRVQFYSGLKCLSRIRECQILLGSTVAGNISQY